MYKYEAPAVFHIPKQLPHVSHIYSRCNADSLIIFPVILLLMSLIPGFFMKIARLFSVHRKEQKLCLL